MGWSSPTVPKLVALALVVLAALVVLWDGFVFVLAGNELLISSVIRDWFARSETLRFAAWLLVYHLFAR